ncbi:MAG: thiolase family protein [Chloroflexi bacterium]|nr:thiolase family protein [Chloroflexota bacterium]
MKEAVIVSAVRTAIGRAPRGALRHTRPEHLAAEVVKEAIRRAPGLSSDAVEDIVLGCAFPEAEAGLNIGRVVALKSGLPASVPGQTVNRFCASGLEAIAIAAQRIMTGLAEVIIAGGVESTSIVPLGGNKLVPDPDLVASYPQAYITMGLTAENVARKFNISREEQDKFALSSQQKAARAIADGKFREQILPIKVVETSFENGKVKKKESTFEVDECPRPDTTLEALASLKPVFHARGTVTAGNSCPTNDGASVVVLMCREKAKELGLKPMGVFRAYAAAGVPPELMGIGPIAAVPKALKLAGLSLSQIDLIELNEAFAAQVVYVTNFLGMDMSNVNVNGGAIALGHPFGATGGILTTKLLYEMAVRQSRFGMVTMCVGGGMGAAGIFEREG